MSMTWQLHMFMFAVTVTRNVRWSLMNHTSSLQHVSGHCQGHQDAYVIGRWIRAIIKWPHIVTGVSECDIKLPRKEPSGGQTQRNLQTDGQPHCFLSQCIAILLGTREVWNQTGEIFERTQSCYATTIYVKVDGNGNKLYCIWYDTL